MSTTPTQIRLTDEDKIKIRQIQERWGLPSAAAAIRHAISMAVVWTDALEKDYLKKSRKGA